MDEKIEVEQCADNPKACLKVIEKGDLDAAMQAASLEATTTGGSIYPGNGFTQGGRWFVSTAMGFPGIVKNTHTDPATKGEDPESHRNRPVDKAHVKEIRRYFETEKHYICPAFLICADVPLNFYVGYKGSTNNTCFGFLVIPPGCCFIIQDGQHRKEGAAPLTKTLLKLDGAAVVISVEDDLDQVQQDFADCATTKPVSQALLATYSRRDLFSQFMRELPESIPIFKDRIEKVSKLVAKKSSKIYTSNNIRAAVAILLTGTRQAAGTIGETTKEMEVHLNEAVRSKTLTKVAEFFNAFAVSNEQYRSILNGTHPSEIRLDSVLLSATGLLVISEVGFEILKISDAAARKTLVEKMASLDWRKQAEMWQGSIVQTGSTINQSRNLLVAACNKILTHLALPLKPVTGSL